MNLREIKKFHRVRADVFVFQTIYSHNSQNSHVNRFSNKLKRVDFIKVNGFHGVYPQAQNIPEIYGVYVCIQHHHSHAEWRVIFRPNQDS